MSSNSLGVIYVAYGYEYFVMACHSAMTLREHNHSVDVTVVTNLPIVKITCGRKEVFDNIVVKDESSDRNRTQKMRAALYTNHEHNVFLDCDTEVRGSIEPMAIILDRFDVAIRANPYDTEYLFDLYNDVSTSDIPIPEWNSGVIFFRNNEGARELFDIWEHKFKEMGVRRDQPAFAYAAINATRCRIFPLSPAWNSTNRLGTDIWFFKNYGHQVRIFHYRRPESEPEVAKRLLNTLHNLKLELEKDSSELRGEFKRLAVLYRMYANPLFRFRPVQKLLLRFYRWVAKRQGVEDLRIGRTSHVKGGRARRLGEGR